MRTAVTADASQYPAYVPFPATEFMPEHCVMTGSKSPADRFVRPDIRTRLGWGAVFHIKPLDAEMWTVLLTQAKSRGFEVTPEARQWMKTYLPRDIKTLSHLLSEMDRELLAQKKAAVTVPLLKKWLQKKAMDDSGL